MQANAPRILYLAGRELSYSRNDVILRAFRRFGEVEVVGVKERPASLLVSSLGIAIRAIPKLLFPAYDLVFVGFYGHLLMLPTGLLARRPILFDAFVSTHDTLSADRKRISAGSPVGRLAFWLDQAACRLATHILLDTPRHAAFFAGAFDLMESKLSAIPVGCNEDIFFPRVRSQPGAYTQVLYYSSYLPLHGAETVVRAAGLLKTEPVRFRLIGEGQDYARVRSLAGQLQLNNLEFIPFLPLERLPGELTAADIVLGGHFGSSEKAGRVVPGKVYQILAMARPLVAGDTPANRDLLVHSQHAYLCPPCAPAALAEAILTLHRNPGLRDRLAVNGRTLYETACSEAVITQQLKSLVEALTS